MVQKITQLEAKKIDSDLIEMGFSLNSLIEIAGYLAYNIISDILKKENIKNILILIGPGNNGRDGLVISKYLKIENYNVKIWCNKTVHPDLLKICKNLEIENVLDFEISNFDLIIDSIFGFSYKPPLREPYLSVINKIKNHKKIISIDVPTSYVVDKENTDCIFKPLFVICFVAPKFCCVGLNVYVVKCFVPRSICKYLNDLNYDSYRYYESLK
ncbi:YjeF domain-containing protein [Hamiltosporidium magnivora]|uniref:NAD(P)H-hydrate epimerase n=1 Tax=Hamiltosporidium magnivora TaxID=148818 RepID=A0A4Q9LNM6_9MICR|nr:YjeF domain-containing protein [Hamiltosporidium magnivora]